MDDGDDMEELLADAVEHGRKLQAALGARTEGAAAWEGEARDLAARNVALEEEISMVKRKAREAWRKERAAFDILQRQHEAEKERYRADVRNRVTTLETEKDDLLARLRSAERGAAEARARRSTVDDAEREDRIAELERALEGAVADGTRLQRMLESRDPRGSDPVALAEAMRRVGAAEARASAMAERADLADRREQAAVRRADEAVIRAEVAQQALKAERESGGRGGGPSSEDYAALQKRAELLEERLEANERELRKAEKAPEKRLHQAQKELSALKEELYATRARAKEAEARNRQGGDPARVADLESEVRRLRARVAAAAPQKEGERDREQDLRDDAARVLDNAARRDEVMRVLVATADEIVSADYGATVGETDRDKLRMVRGVVRKMEAIVGGGPVTPSSNRKSDASFFPTPDNVFGRSPDTSLDLRGAAPETASKRDRPPVAPRRTSSPNGERPPVAPRRSSGTNGTSLHSATQDPELMQQTVTRLATRLRILSAENDALRNRLGEAAADVSSMDGDDLDAFPLPLLAESSMVDDGDADTEGKPRRARGDREELQATIDAQARAIKAFEAAARIRDAKIADQAAVIKEQRVIIGEHRRAVDGDGAFSLPRTPSTPAQTVTPGTAVHASPFPATQFPGSPFPASPMPTASPAPPMAPRTADAATPPPVTRRAVAMDEESAESLKRTTAQKMDAIAEDVALRAQERERELTQVLEREREAARQREQDRERERLARAQREQDQEREWEAEKQAARARERERDQQREKERERERQERERRDREWEEERARERRERTEREEARAREDARARDEARAREEARAHDSLRRRAAQREAEELPTRDTISSVSSVPPPRISNAPYGAPPASDPPPIPVTAARAPPPPSPGPLAALLGQPSAPPPAPPAPAPAPAPSPGPLAPFVGVPAVAPAPVSPTPSSNGFGTLDRMLTDLDFIMSPGGAKRPQAPAPAPAPPQMAPPSPPQDNAPPVPPRQAASQPAAAPASPLGPPPPLLPTRPPVTPPAPGAKGAAPPSGFPPQPGANAYAYPPGAYPPGAYPPGYSQGPPQPGAPPAGAPPSLPPGAIPKAAPPAPTAAAPKSGPASPNTSPTAPTSPPGAKGRPLSPPHAGAMDAARPAPPLPAADGSPEPTLFRLQLSGLEARDVKQDNLYVLVSYDGRQSRTDVAKNNHKDNPSWARAFNIDMRRGAPTKVAVELKTKRSVLGDAVVGELSIDASALTPGKQETVWHPLLAPGGKKAKTPMFLKTVMKLILNAAVYRNLMGGQSPPGARPVSPGRSVSPQTGGSPRGAPPPGPASGAPRR